MVKSKQNFFNRAKIHNPTKGQLKYLMIVQFIVVFAAFVNNMFAIKSIEFFGIVAVAANLTFPICYAMSDIVGELLSIKRVVQLVLISYAVQLGIFGLAAAAQLFPIVPGNEIGAEAFGIMFGFVPRVVLASFVAFMIGSVTNAIVLKGLPNKTFGFKTRAMISTIVGEFFDTWVFLAVLGVSINWDNALKLALVKTLVEAIILPITAKVKNKIERA